MGLVDQADRVMAPESPKVDEDKPISPHAREIEYALILQRMIDMVNQDPSRMRAAIYDFARARLKIESAWAEGPERDRLATALETAIQGVESFSARRDEMERLPGPAGPAQIGYGTPSAPQPQAVAPAMPVTPEPDDILVPKKYYPSERQYPPDHLQPILNAGQRSLVATFARFAVGMLLFISVVALAYNKHRLPLLGEQLDLSRLTGRGDTAAVPPATGTAQQAALPAEMKAPDPPTNALPFPTPADYGIYALNDAALNELFMLPERVPDKRISVSTPVTEPSRTTLPDGKAKFILFRRDLAGNAPERIDVRVVARVMRALTFDARGKPGYTPVTDAWNIRNVSFELRLRPIAGNPEMLLAQPEKADFELPPGRYVLVLKDQGYDFTVAGKITALAQCLERTDAANGVFYSECQKP
jgi:hypothetical protein